MPSIIKGRRSFVSALASLSVFAGFDRTAGAQSTARSTAPTGEWDLSWIEQLKGSHKQVFDYGSFDLSDDRRPLRFVRNYLDPCRDVFGLAHPEVNTAVGISRSGFPMNASDALWRKYGLGARFKIIDADTKEPAVRNIFFDDGAAGLGVKAMQSRGTVFWQCNVALSAIAQQLADATRQPVQDVRRELIDGLNAGVHLVPSHMLALGLFQERGFSYVKA